MELTLWTYEGPPHIGAMRVRPAFAVGPVGLHNAFKFPAIHFLVSVHTISSSWRSPRNCPCSFCRARRNTDSNAASVMPNSSAAAFWLVSR